MKSWEWAFDRTKETFDLVAQDEAEKVSFLSGVVQKHRRRRLGRNVRLLQGNELGSGCKEAAGGSEGKSLVGHESSQREERIVL